MTFIGLLYPCLAIFGYDVYTRKNKTLKKISRWRKRNVDIWQLRSFNNILQIVAPLIPLSEKTERKMNDDLARADIPYTAQEYYAKAILSSIAGIFLALLGLSMKSYIIVLGGILLSIYLYFHNYDQLKDTLSDKYSIIENEIPTFIRSIESGLHTDRDIIHVMEQYKKIASPALASELDLLISDMRTSSVSAALTRFDSRMGSPEISRLVAALIEVDRGVDASLTLSYLAADMTTMHKQLIQRELDKRPGKMKRAILPAGIILVVMMFYMLIEAVIQSAQGIF
jgi:hypothetical protein